MLSEGAFTHSDLYNMPVMDRKYYYYKIKEKHDRDVDQMKSNSAKKK